MKDILSIFLSIALFTFLLVPGAFIRSAGAAPSLADWRGEAAADLISDNTLPGDFFKPEVKGRECVETCLLQEEYYGDEGYGEEQYEEQYDDGGMNEGGAEEQYDDEYGDEQFQEEVYPEEQYEEQYDEGDGYGEGM